LQVSESLTTLPSGFNPSTAGDAVTGALGERSEVGNGSEGGAGGGRWRAVVRVAGLEPGMSAEANGSVRPGDIVMQVLRASVCIRRIRCEWCWHSTSTKTRGVHNMQAGMRLKHFDILQTFFSSTTFRS
jgi:hypothetical protein